MLQSACRDLSITLEQLHAELAQGGDLQDLKSGALTHKGLRLVAEALVLCYAETRHHDVLRNSEKGSRCEEALALLAREPRATSAVTTDTDTEPDSVIVALALRGKSTCELRIPTAKYDGLALLQLVEQQRVGSTTNDEVIP
jgi:hypothetical protein